jgi:hypothetical protein
MRGFYHHLRDGSRRLTHYGRSDIRAQPSLRPAKAVNRVKAA